MLQILGMGHASPVTVIDNAFLESLDIGATAAWIESELGIETRRTSLPLEYIRETRNAAPEKSFEAALDSPTTLGEKAARMALERAGIEPGQIGLIVADCSTPVATTPSEAQRIGNALKVKTLAYDITTAATPLAAYLDAFGGWQKDRVPEYALCVSTATFTQKVDYRKPLDAAMWGDGAGAFVISTKHSGKLSVEHASYSTDSSRVGSTGVGIFNHFAYESAKEWRAFTKRRSIECVREMEELGVLDSSSDTLVFEQLSSRFLEELGEHFEISKERQWYNVKEYGNTGGASAVSLLSSRWDQIDPGMKVGLISVGLDCASGSVVLKG